MNKQQKGFTLVEMIVVIAIIALISITATVAFRNVRRVALDESVATDANRLKVHYSLYRTIFKDSDTTFTSEMSAHAFCPLCPEAGEPGFLDHKDECSEVEVTITWDSNRRNTAGLTAWDVAFGSSDPP
jgi:prepilin-type N-terminal cleavage/methylation domain-containing protein